MSRGRVTLTGGFPLTATTSMVVTTSRSPATVELAGSGWSSSMPPVARAARRDAAGSASAGRSTVHTTPMTFFASLSSLYENLSACVIAAQSNALKQVSRVPVFTRRV